MSDERIQEDGKHKAWQEVLLIAVPILVIVIAVAFSPQSEKGFWGTITSKPEWYFLALVFSIEAHRDRQRTAPKSDDLGIMFIALAAVLAGLAAAASVTVAPHATAASTPVAFLEAILEKLQNPLQFFSVPVFLLAAWWSWYSKSNLKKSLTEVQLLQSMREALAQPKLYDVFKDGAVQRFYDRVAPVYNKRNDNTRGIREAQDRIIGEIRQLVRSNPHRSVSVLDIGGGTGHNVYLSLRGEDGLRWTSLDLSAEMTNRFRENFPGVRAIHGNSFKLRECLEAGEQFDVVVLSFTLSSMPRSLNFSELASYLSAESILLVTDIHPGYVQKSPCFDIDVDGARHQLQLRKVEPLVLEQDLQQHGFARAAWNLFRNERGEVYSYFVRFDARPEVDREIARLRVVEST